VAAIEGPPPQGPSKFARAVRRQTAAFSSTVAVLAGTPVVRSIPIRVVTAGEPVWPTPELNDEWRQAHQRLASSAENGQLLVAERSGHMITETEPDIIVAVVSELLGAGR
jgi:pimeloyl-ACP methyl ester carboxylesterase